MGYGGYGRSYGGYGRSYGGYGGYGYGKRETEAAPVAEADAEASYGYGGYGRSYGGYGRFYGGYGGYGYGKREAEADVRLAMDMAAMEATAALTEDMDVPTGGTVDTVTERGKLMLMQATDMEDTKDYGHSLGGYGGYGHSLGGYGGYGQSYGGYSSVSPFASVNIAGPTPASLYSYPRKDLPGGISS